jgi:hypothetical protein
MTLHGAINYAKNIICLAPMMKSDELISKLNTSIANVNTLLAMVNTFGEWSSEPKISAQDRAKIDFHNAKLMELDPKLEDGLYDDKLCLEYDTLCDQIEKMKLDAYWDSIKTWESSAPKEVMDFVKTLVAATDSLKNLILNNSNFFENTNS